MAISAIEICDGVRQLLMFFIFTLEEIKIVSLFLNICRSMKENYYKPISNKMF